MKFYGQIVDGKPLDQLIYARYCGFKNGFFIEAGAGDGIFENTCKFFEDNLDWRGINVEPFKRNYNLLVKNRKSSINLNVALSDRVGTAKFMSSDSAFNCGSINGPTPFLRSLNTKVTESIVQTTTYDLIVANQNINKVDLLVLDVEGHELRVIDGMHDHLPQIIAIEYGHCGLSRIKAKLCAIGYRIDYTDSVNAFFKLT